MSFVLNMAWREMRSSWLRLLLFFLCIALGVGSMVSLRSFTHGMRVSIAREARTLYGADVRVALNQRWMPETRAALERYSHLPLVTGHTEILEMQTMVRPSDDPEARPVIAQLVAVQKGFPLYGEVRLAGGAHYTHALLQGRGVLASPGLLRLLNLEVGDRVDIGFLAFTVRGEIEKQPGSLVNFRPIPRVLVDSRDAEAAGLTGFGSVVSYGWLFRTREGQDEALLNELWREFRSTRLNWLGSFRHQQGFMNTVLERVEGFLGLVGFAILIIGGIGVSSVARVFVQQRIKTIAILKCLGAENRRVLGSYLLQVLALGLAGSLLGLLVAWIVTVIGSRYADGRLPLDLDPGLSVEAALQGVGIGLLVSLLFGLPPLLEIRNVKPLLVLRQNPAVSRWRFDWIRIGAGILILAGLLALAAWQSSSVKNGGILLGGLIATAAVLNLASLALMYWLGRMRRLPLFALRQGVRSLYRPGNQTRGVVVTVGLGALFIVAIRLHQEHLQREYSLDLDSVAADMFLVDMRRDQIDAVEAAVAGLGGTAFRTIPILRARVVGLRRGPGNFNREKEESVGRRLGGEESVTYLRHVPLNERIVAGNFWDPSPGAEPEISVEENYGRRLGLALGDRLIFEVYGRRIEAKISSVRRMERRIRPVSYLTRFNIVFRPGTLEKEPHLFIGALQGPAAGEKRARFQRQFVEQFLNVSVIDAFDTIHELRKGIAEVSLAVSFLGGFVLMCGVLILIGSIVMTKFSRLYEAAIFKTLGADRKQIAAIALVEYGMLGLLAGVIGSGAAVALTWAVSKYGLEMAWSFEPSINLIGAAATLMMVAVIGLLASWDVMMKKPLGILRSE